MSPNSERIACNLAQCKLLLLYLLDYGTNELIERPKEERCHPCIVYVEDIAKYLNLPTKSVGLLASRTPTMDIISTCGISVDKRNKKLYFQFRLTEDTIDNQNNSIVELDNYLHQYGPINDDNEL